MAKNDDGGAAERERVRQEVARREAERDRAAAEAQRLADENRRKHEREGR